MKKIFVTVAEFSENGGILRKGREIFEKRKDTFIHTFTCNGQSETVNNDAAAYYYIQIDCTPIYK